VGYAPYQVEWLLALEEGTMKPVLSRLALRGFGGGATFGPRKILYNNIKLKTQNIILY
jgi:hypothetical protein